MLDELKLKTVYYSGPAPKNPSVLTLLAIVFDEVHFPGVYLPRDGYDKGKLEIEIKRLLDLPGKDPGTLHLVGMLRFLDTANDLRDVLKFEHSWEDARRFSDSIPKDLPKEVDELLFGPLPPGQELVFTSFGAKGLPGGNESTLIPDGVYYLAGAFKRAAELRLPLLNDEPGLPIPGTQRSAKDESKLLAAVLSVEAATIALRDMKIIRPRDIGEFRDKNKALLTEFRKTILRYSAMLNDRIGQNATPAEVGRLTKFFVETEIAPVIDDLIEETRKSSKFPWAVLQKSFEIGCDLASNWLEMDAKSAVAQTILKHAPGFLNAGVKMKLEKSDVRRRSGLHYLVKAKGVQ